MKIFGKKPRIITFKPGGFGDCAHKALGYIEPWHRNSGILEKVGDSAVCLNCGNGVFIPRGIQLFEFPELTRTPGVFHHTPSYDRRRALGLTA